MPAQPEKGDSQGNHTRDPTAVAAAYVMSVMLLFLHGTPRYAILSGLSRGVAQFG